METTLVLKQRLQPSGGLKEGRSVLLASYSEHNHLTSITSVAYPCFAIRCWHAMFSPSSARTSPMSLAPRQARLSLCDAPTMLEVRRQSHYPLSRATSAAKSPHSSLLGRWRLRHDRGRNQRIEVRPETSVKTA